MSHLPLHECLDGLYSVILDGAAEAAVPETKRRHQIAVTNPSFAQLSPIKKSLVKLILMEEFRKIFKCLREFCVF